MYVFDWKLRSNPYKYAGQSLLAVLSIGLILYFLDLEVQTAIIASLGATAFTVFSRPRHFTSSFRTVLGGYAAGMASGLFCDFYIKRGALPGEYAVMISGGIAVGAAIFIMVTTNTEHPPAAGAALGIVLNQWNSDTLVFMLVSVTAMMSVKELLKPYMINLIGEAYPPHLGMRLLSPVFPAGGVLPEKYYCCGEDIPPPLEIKNVPEEARSLALVLTDSNGLLGLKEHWVVWNIPPETSRIEGPGIPAAVPGANDFGTNGYVGPMPRRKKHTYVFRLYALDRILDIPEGSGVIKLERGMGGCMLDKCSLRFVCRGEED